MNTTAELMPVLIDPHEAIDLAVNETRNFGPEQTGRFSAVNGGSTFEQRCDRADTLLNDSLYADGSLLFYDRELESILACAALRHLGHQAVRLHDEVDYDAGGGYVVLTSRPFPLI